MPEFNDIVHAPVRLASLCLLASRLDASAAFTDIATSVNTTMGNLHCHLRALALVGYVELKRSRDTDERLIVVLTPEGRAALNAHVAHLRALLARFATKLDQAASSTIAGRQGGPT